MAGCLRAEVKLRETATSAAKQGGGNEEMGSWEAEAVENQRKDTASLVPGRVPKSR